MIPKRLFWLLIGYGAGLTTSWWARRRVRDVVRRYRPDVVGERVGSSVTGLGRSMRDSLRDSFAMGRVAARERESELRVRYGLAGPSLADTSTAGPSASGASRSGTSSAGAGHALR